MLIRLARRILALLLLALGAAGCGTFEQQSDWRWKQYNPDYRPPLPPSDMFY